jgi:hypothetical protein
MRPRTSKNPMMMTAMKRYQKLNHNRPTRPYRLLCTGYACSFGTINRFLFNSGTPLSVTGDQDSGCHNGDNETIASEDVVR